MSNYILGFLLPGYEDYEPYLYRSCTLRHWPQMWDGERQAEHGLWEERYKQIKKKIKSMVLDLHINKA